MENFSNGGDTGDAEVIKGKGGNFVGGSET